MAGDGKLGKVATDGVDWSAPRLICIAGDFNRYDDHAVKQMQRNIELIRYRGTSFRPNDRHRLLGRGDGQFELEGVAGLHGRPGQGAPGGCPTALAEAILDAARDRGMAGRTTC